MAVSKLTVLCSIFLGLWMSKNQVKGEDCDWVKLKSDGYIYYQTDKLNKKYERQDGLTNDGKPVFQRSGGNEYMYWKQSTYSWMVGSTLGSSSVSLYTFSNESHPADIPKHQTWYVASTFFWVSYSSISVECTSRDLESWEAALIAVAVIIVVGVLIGVCVYCINKKSKENTTVQPAGPVYGGYSGVYYTAGPNPCYDGGVNFVGQPPPPYQEPYSGRGMATAVHGANGGHQPRNPGPGLPPLVPRPGPRPNPFVRGMPPVPPQNPSRAPPHLPPGYSPEQKP